MEVVRHYNVGMDTQPLLFCTKGKAIGQNPEIIISAKNWYPINYGASNEVRPHLIIDAEIFRQSYHPARLLWISYTNSCHCLLCGFGNPGNRVRRLETPNHHESNTSQARNSPLTALRQVKTEHLALRCLLNFDGSRQNRCLFRCNLRKEYHYPVRYLISSFETPGLI